MERHEFEDIALRRALESQLRHQLTNRLWLMVSHCARETDTLQVVTLLMSGIADIILENHPVSEEFQSSSRVAEQLAEHAKEPWRHLVLSVRNFATIDNVLDEEYLRQVLLQLYGALYHSTASHVATVIAETRK